MNSLTVNGKQNFMGKEIPIILGGFGEGKKCICDKTIAEIHNQPVSEIRRRINDNISRFKENVDIIDLKKGMGESHTSDFILGLGYTKSAITQAEHIYLLSERGYSKLIKIMDTDLAWEIHDNIMDEYFQLREKKQAGMILPKDFPSALRAYADEVERRQIAEQEKERLQQELDYSKEWLSIKRVAAMNGVEWKIFDWRKLKTVGLEMGYSVKKIFDANYGEVNTYHKDVWEACYPEYEI